jgi:hypothetical protein
MMNRRNRDDSTLTSRAASLSGSQFGKSGTIGTFNGAVGAATITLPVLSRVSSTPPDMGKQSLGLRSPGM